jgi:hypothetical protein
MNDYPRQAEYEERKKAGGYKRINMWIPIRDEDEIREIAEKLNRAYADEIKPKKRRGRGRQR